MKMLQYQAKIYKDGNSYSVEFPDLPGCFSTGDDLDDAKKNAQEALSLYLEEAVDPEWDVPEAKDHKGKDLYWIEVDPAISIPLIIRQLRRDRKISQNLVAKRMGIPVQQYQKMEYPRKSNPTIKNFLDLCDALNYEILFRKKKA